MDKGSLAALPLSESPLKPDLKTFLNFLLFKFLTCKYGSPLSSPLSPNYLLHIFRGQKTYQRSTVATTSRIWSPVIRKSLTGLLWSEDL